MSARYPIPAATTHTEIQVLNSRFVASAAHTASVADAKAFIAAVRMAHPAANHHCVAYLVGYGASVTAGLSDDGEPSGTAGRPMLAVLRGADLGDVTVVVTRYFGGTLLGTGGLVRAYSDAVRAVLAILPRTERIELCQLRIDVSYAAYATARRILEAHQVVILQETFAELVQIDAHLACDVRDTVCAQLIDQSAGQAHIAML